ncbi:MAG TPA: peptidase, partial [Lysobacter sp.]|nr:peptidase [Lysobacter sp.]
MALAATFAVGAAQAANPVFDVNELDPAVSACQDFNAYANGKWIAANPIPADRTRWGAFDELREQSLAAQHKIADAANANADQAKAGSIEQKIGWFYRSGMDEAAVEKAGYDPVKGDLARIDALKTPADIVAWLTDST